jgi:hypothetical protein
MKDIDYEKIERDARKYKFQAIVLFVCYTSMAFIIITGLLIKFIKYIVQ